MIDATSKAMIEHAVRFPNAAEVLDKILVRSMADGDFELVDYVTTSYFLLLSDKMQQWLVLSGKMAQLCIRKAQIKR